MLATFPRYAAEFVELAREGTIVGAWRYLLFKLRKNRLPRPAAPRVHRGLGIVGAGTHAASRLLPCLAAHRAPIYAVVSREPNKARALAGVYGVAASHSNLTQMLADDACEAVVLATPHFLHPDQIVAVVRANRYTYCEKPVAIDAPGIGSLVNNALGRDGGRVMVGFNRRFAPAILQLRQSSWLANRRTPMEMQYRVNFGERIANAMSDPANGGGRLHGAACHYVDLIAHLAGCAITRVSAAAVLDGGQAVDTFAAVMTLEDGTIASLSFSSEGARRNDVKEEIVLSCGGHVARILNFRRLEIDGRAFTFTRHSSGMMNAIGAFLQSYTEGKPVPVGLAEGIAATTVTLAIERSIRSAGSCIAIPPEQITD